MSHLSFVLCQLKRMSCSTTTNMMRILELVILLAAFTSINAVEINCSQPPQLVDPQSCCTDAGRDDVTERCAAKHGMTAQSHHVPSPDTATCLAECILTESQFLIGQNMNIAAVQARLQQQFPSDPEYVRVMLQAYEKCTPIAQRKLQELQQSPQGLRTRCSPLSSIILGCSFTHYFRNCPSNHWNPSEQCQVAKEFLEKCAIF